MPTKRTQTPSFLVDAEGAHDKIDPELVRQHLAESEFFWLDLHKPKPEDIALLAEVGGVLHGERMELEHVGQQRDVLGLRLVQVEPEELALGEMFFDELLVDVFVSPAGVHEERGGVRRLLRHAIPFAAGHEHS